MVRDDSAGLMRAREQFLSAGALST
ncbi:MAG: hypothetical protein K0R68_575, partial [Mycobacterium sp.]|nr:hypothetical protein [Mycobacterium sp.]